MRCCPESLKEYTAGNSASTPTQRTQTAIGLKAFYKIAVHNAVIYAALLYERNWHNAKLTCSAVLRLIREPVEPRLVGTQKHSDHARPVHFDKLSDRKGRCTSTGPLVCRTNPAGSERFDRLVSSSKHSDHARPVHFDKLSDRKGRCTSTGPLVCRTNLAGSERFDKLSDRKISLPSHGW